MTAGPSATAAFLQGLASLDMHPRAVLRAIADDVAGVTARQYVLPSTWQIPPADLQTPVDADPWLLGQVREVLHPGAARTALGAWFTPRSVARSLVGEVDPACRPRVVMDPACGGGSFLLAAHERFPRARLVGTDIDPIAVETTRVALDLAGCTDHDIRVADGLTVAPPADVDLVVGNPPFLSQLLDTTTRTRARREELLAGFGSLATRYVDDAALFVLRAARDLLTVGGHAVLVVPEALLATGDGAALRAEVDRFCTVAVTWRDTEGVFPGVATCALLLRRRPTPADHPADHPPATSADTSTDRVPTTSPDRSDRASTWSHLLAEGVPLVALGRSATVGDLATATADFRQAYYLLADHVEEGPDVEGHGSLDVQRRYTPDVATHPATPDLATYRIVPVGLIDPAHLRWGTAPVRFAKRWWSRPVAVGLPEDFLARRLGPKVLVATQTKVLEVLVDEEGDLLPSTPVITIRADLPWHVGAALTSPVATAVAARSHAGAALSRTALKLSARQVLALPVPASPSPAWDRAAEAFRAAHTAADTGDRRQLLVECGTSMMAAHDVDDPVLLQWWTDRLPSR